MNITENNKIIAEFMEMTQGKPDETRWRNDWFEKLSVNGNTFESGRRHTHLHFHSDWNWLMEVVDKIINLKEVYAEERQKVYKSISPNIETTYNACIEFIKWYKTNIK